MVSGIQTMLGGFATILSGVTIGGASTLAAATGVGAPVGAAGLVISGTAVAVGAVAVAAGAIITAAGAVVVNAASKNYGDNFRKFQGAGTGGELKKIYNSIKESPNYPDGFSGVQNGTTKQNINNQTLLEQLRKVEPGSWKKIYRNGYVNGEEVSIHYFESPSGKVFDVKVIDEWSIP